MLVRPNEKPMKIMSMSAIGAAFVKEGIRLKEEACAGQLWLVRDGEDPKFVVLPYNVFLLIQGYLASTIERS